MKKVLPIIILLAGVLVVAGAFLFVKSKNNEEQTVDVPSQEEVVPVVALEKRPVVSMTPSADGHWLKLEIKKILIDAATLDYEMTYKVPDGRTQGVPGSVKLTTKDDITKDLLLGSESSGKFRYDEGVENGQLVLRFRDGNGKLVAKFSTDFYLQNNKNELSFVNGDKYKLDKTDKKIFYISMDTIGFPGEPKNIPSEVYGIFSSSAKGNSGILETNGSYLWIKGEWVEINSGKSLDVGYFVIIS
jgi:hypothetical protein